MDLLKKYLLSTAMRFAPPDRPNAGGGTDDGGGPNGGQGDQVDDDDRIEFTDDDDEGIADPIGETDEDDENQDDEDDDGGANDDAGVGGQPPPQQSRGSRQYGELRRQARETARQNAELTRQLAEVRGEMAALRAPAQVVETPAQRAERLALLSPEERIQETVNETLRAHEQRAQVLQNQLLDQADQAAFQARAAVNPLLKKLAPEIERRLQDLRAKGQNLPREVVATYLIGEKVMQQQGRKPGGNRQTRRQRESARPIRSQSDMGGQRPRRGGAPQTAEDYESQFGDVPI